MPSIKNSIEYVITAVDKASKTFRSTADSIRDNEKAMGGFNVASLAAAAKTAAVTTAVVKLARSASQLQQLQISFETMLGDAEAARKKIEELSDFASKTPFTMPGVENAARQLMAVGFSAEELIPTLKAVGDVAAGIGRGQAGLDRLILNLGQVRTQGKLTGRELRDFAVNGVPLMEELAKSMGKTKAEIQEMTAAGKITSDIVEKAFKNMTSEGGRFADLMSKQNKTLLGQWSNLQDELERLSRTIGTTFVDDLSEAITEMANLIGATRTLIEDYPKLADVIGAVVQALTVAIPVYRETKNAIIGLHNAIASLGNFLGFNMSKYEDFAKVNEDWEFRLKNSELQLEKTMEKARAMGIALGPVTEETEALGEAMGGGSGADKKANKLADAMLKLQDAYGDTNTEINHSLIKLKKDHQETMQGLEDDLQGVRDSLKELEEDYKSANLEIQSSMADTIIDQRKRVEELEKEKASVEDILKAQEALARMERTFGRQEGAEAALAEAQRRSELEAAERRFEDLQKQQEERAKEFEDKKAKLEEEMTLIDQKKIKEKEAHESLQNQMILTQEKLAIFHKEYTEKMKNMEEVTEQTVSAMAERLTQLQSIISQMNALGGVAAARGLERVQGRQGGGPASGLVRVGETGPETVALPVGSRVIDAGTSRRIEGGQDVNINVSAPIIGTVFVTNEADEKRLAARIEESFTRMMRAQKLRAN